MPEFDSPPPLLPSFSPEPRLPLSSPFELDLDEEDNDVNTIQPSLVDYPDSPPAPLVDYPDSPLVDYPDSPQEVRDEPLIDQWEDDEDDLEIVRR